MTTPPLRIGLIGAGYIAAWHADALRAVPGVELTAVCDPNLDLAEGLAAAHGARAFGDLDDLIGAGLCDGVHILTPPDLHHPLALQCLRAGLHVLVEKPVALNAAQTQEIEDAARAANRRFHAGHNFLGLPSYTRLKREIRRGALGRVSGAEIRWCYPFGPLRAGPFGIWPLRDTRNLMLEFGPHLMSLVIDLFGLPEIEHVALSKPVALPGAGTRPQGWRILARAGEVELVLILSLVETADDRSVTIRGSSARARLDLAADTLIIDAENTADLVANPLLRQLSLAGQHLTQGSTNAARQLTSVNRKSPYALSFRGLANGIWEPLAQNAPADPRWSGSSAVAVMTALDAVLAKVDWPAPVPAKPSRKPAPSAMVIGGTGFIGRALTRELVARGNDVRVISRGRQGPFADLPDQIETVSLSLRDTDGLAQAMAGIDTVYNLARSTDSNWEDCLQNDVAVAEGIGKAALSAGVRRLVYTGTIASFDMSDPALTITDATPLPGEMEDRNLYARSKAECESRLMALHRKSGLPLVIARPGIVLGAGGPLQHWGIGRWHGAGAVRLWGNGRNPLPFVLIGDCVDGLIRCAEAEGIEGRAFNLVGPPILSARDYFDAIHDRLGARIRVSGGNLSLMYAADWVKFQLKTRVLGRGGLTRPSRADWLSRAHQSRFDISGAQAALGWQPVSDADTFLTGAVDQAGLLGF